ncbi:MAG: Lrp/AsnC family transcriptional regulator [Clostridia bacterium]|nr:Lrp/AsnC family transcriptional regulator [Clostridia bacterium]
MNDIEKKFLKLIETDARLTEKQIAVVLEKEEGDVRALFEKFEEDGTILGYKTVVNKEKLGEEIVNAMIELKITPQHDRGFGNVAELLCNFEEVKSVFLMSGVYDLALMIEGRTMRDIAFFVAEKLATLEYVTSTATHFVLRKYKEDGIVYGDAVNDDKRGMI